MICPHCHETVPIASFCERCNRILPVAEGSHWEILGFENESMNLDPADLERRLFELSRKFHPDRYASKTPLEVDLAQARSAAVNNAYRTLKDPVARANYLVERKLGSISEKSSHVPADMADLFFEVQEHLDDVRSAGEQPPEQAVAEVRNAEKELIQKVQELEKNLQSSFLEYDGAPDVRIVENMKGILAERSYIKSFLRQVDSVMTGERGEIQE